MTDMFFPSLLIFATVSLVLAFLPQYDICARLVNRIVKSLADHLHKPA